MYCNHLKSQFLGWITVTCSLVYITVDCVLSVSSNHDSFPPHFNIFRSIQTPRISHDLLFTPCSLTTVKQFVWIGLHGSDMLLSQNLFHIFKELSCMVVKGLGLKAQHNQRQIQRDQGVTTTTRERLHLRVENMVFEFLFYLLLMTVDFKSFGQHVFFGYMSTIFLKIISNINEINCQT
jgi:hypothetical protein